MWIISELRSLSSSCSRSIFWINFFPRVYFEFFQLNFLSFWLLKENSNLLIVYPFWFFIKDQSKSLNLSFCICLRVFKSYRIQDSSLTWVALFYLSSFSELKVFKLRINPNQSHIASYIKLKFLAFSYPFLNVFIQRSIKRVLLLHFINWCPSLGMTCCHYVMKPKSKQWNEEKLNRCSN